MDGISTIRFSNLWPIPTLKPRADGDHPMRQTQSRFGIERHLTPELFDHYVAKARAERSKAIAAFIGQVAGWLSALRRRSRAASETPISTSRGLTGSAR